MNIQPTIHPRSNNGRRGRGRSNSGGYRRDYTTRNLNSVQEIGQMQQHSPSHGIDQQMMSNSPNYGGGAAGGGYFMHTQYPGAIFTNQMPMGHHSAAAQHAAGTPLYINNHLMYPYYPHGGILYPAMLPQPEYPIGDEKGEEQMNPENISGVMSPVMWPAEYQQHIENQMPLPSEEFIQPHHTDEYTVQTADEFIPQSANEFTQSPQHQLPPNEFIAQQLSPEFNQNAPPDTTEFLHSSDGQGFVYGRPEPIEQNSPILLNPMYKSNYPPEFVPNNQQQQQHHHTSLPVEFLQPEQNDLGAHQNNETLSFDAYNNNINVEKDGPYENQIMEIPASNSINYNESVASIVRSHESPIQFLQSSGDDIPIRSEVDSCLSEGHISDLHRNIETVPNAIDVNNQKSQQQQLPPQPQKLLPQPQQFAEDNIENVLIQQTNEKLNVHVEKPQETQTPPNVWANRKSTQSVAISVIPSNNYTNQLDQTAVPSSHFAGSESDSGLNNNKLALDNNNSNFVSSSKPTVPKVDETNSTYVPSTKSATEIKSQTAQVTSQSMEIQTVPVEINQKFYQADFAPLGAKVKENVATSTAASENTTWASLFNKGGIGGTPNNRPSEAQKRPIAKVSPYYPKDTANDATKNGSTVTSVSVPQGSNVISNLSYSAASTQNLPNTAAQSLGSTHKKAPTAKATINPTAKPIPVQSSTGETSWRLGGEF